MKGCLNCNTPFNDTVYRTTVCSCCGKELHTCKNCKFYNPSSHWECLETVDEYISDKDRANFCSFFELAEIDDKQKKKTIKKEDLDSLFNL